jgi:23S rRNA maturation mini-RNase III
MEESLSLQSKISNTFACGEIDVKSYSPLALAFMGDCIS